MNQYLFYSLLQKIPFFLSNANVGWCILDENAFTSSLSTMIVKNHINGLGKYIISIIYLQSTSVLYEFPEIGHLYLLGGINTS